MSPDILSAIFPAVQLDSGAPSVRESRNLVRLAAPCSDPARGAAGILPFIEDVAAAGASGRQTAKPDFCAAPLAT